MRRPSPFTHLGALPRPFAMQAGAETEGLLVTVFVPVPLPERPLMGAP